jgi:beta-phosphoglucomutase-like phosphatase (HAD superfamily)
VIRAVLFDLDGLMIDTEPIHFRAFRGFMREFGVELPESMMPEFIGYNEIDNIRVLKQKYRLVEPLEALVMKRRGIYGHLLETEDILALPGFWEVSDEAKRRGMKLAVVSSSIRPQVELPLRRLCEQHPGAGDLHRYFDAIVTGDDVAFTKPAPDSYLLALDQLEIAGKEAIAFEDTPAGVRAAAVAGIPVYAVPNEYTRRLPFPEAAGVLESLAEALPLLSEGSRELPVGN